MLTVLAVARSRNNLANVLYAVGRRKEADLFRKSLAVQEKQLGRADPGCARTMTSLAWLLHELGQPTELEELLREAIASGETALGRNHPDVKELRRRFAGIEHCSACGAEHDQPRLRHRWPHHAASWLCCQPDHSQADRGKLRLDQDDRRTAQNQTQGCGSRRVPVRLCNGSLQSDPDAQIALNRRLRPIICKKPTD